MRKCLHCILILSLLAACGPKGGKSVSAPATRDFPSVEIPLLLEDGAERTAYATAHFWDRFTDTVRVYACDSVTVNGVSLTVCNPTENSFQVAIIPYTLEHTNFCDIKTGTVVNLEFDIIGKYISRMNEIAR